MYRPPSADQSFWKKATLEGAEREEIVLLGDLNVDFLQPSSANFSHLKEALLLPLSLSNLIAQPTGFAKNSHTSLDVVLTNCDKVHSGFEKATPLVHFPKALKRPRDNAGPACYLCHFSAVLT